MSTAFAAEIATEYPDEIMVAAVVAVVSFLWPYVVDIVTTPDTPSHQKRFIAKVYAWIIGPGAVYLVTWIEDDPGMGVRSWIERGLLLIASVFGVQAVTHVGHKMTKETTLRAKAVQAFSGGPSSIDELAPGDKIPRKLQRQLDEKQRAEHAAIMEQVRTARENGENVIDFSKAHEGLITERADLPASVEQKIRARGERFRTAVPPIPDPPAEFEVDVEQLVAESIEQAPPFRPERQE